MYSLRHASRHVFGIHYYQLIKKLAELEWIIRFNGLEIIVNHEYLIYKKGQIYFINNIALDEFYDEYTKKFRGGK